MVAIVSPQPVFRPSPLQRDRRSNPATSRHLRAVPALGDVALPEIAFPEIALPEIALPEIAMPEFELARRLAAAAPSLRPALVRLDQLVDLARWGGSTALRFALVAIALVAAVVAVRASQGLPPTDASTQLAPTAVNSPSSATGAGSSGDVVLSFSATN